MARRNLCSGDSVYIPKFIKNPKEVFDELQKEVTFLPRSELTFQIYGKSMQLPRDKAFFGDVNKDGSFPLYK